MAKVHVHVGFRHRIRGFNISSKVHQRVYLEKKELKLEREIYYPPSLVKLINGLGSSSDLFPVWDLETFYLHPTEIKDSQTYKQFFPGLVVIDRWLFVVFLYRERT